jgi:hypothetical protein
MNRLLKEQGAHLRTLEWYANEGDLGAYAKSAEIVHKAGTKLIDACLNDLAKHSCRR